MSRPEPTPEATSLPIPARPEGRIVAAILGVLVLYQLATWIPHYLTWPLWIDLDDEATFAHGWDAGIVPYRDVFIYQFPGQIYLCWAVGKLFGWGNTAAIYAADVGFLLALLVGLLAWSRRRLGGLVPGLVGVLCLNHYYLGLSYRHAAQRDFQSGVPSVLALLALEALPGRRGRVVSAALVALSAVYRPYAVLMVPALLSALVESTRGAARPRRAALLAVAEFAALAAGFVAIGFLPLILEGRLLDPFLNAPAVHARFAEGQPGLISGVVRDVYLKVRHEPATCLLPAMLGLLATRAGRAERGLIVTWLLAWAGTFFRQGLHVEHHDYLNSPLWMVLAAQAALLVGLLLRHLDAQPAAVRLVSLLLVLGLTAGSPLPKYSSVTDAIRGARALARGEVPPPDAPVGYDHGYPWDDYRDLLIHLRETTDPDQRLLPLLDGHVGIPGMIGRLTLFPFEGGWRWLRDFAPEDADLVIAKLEADPRAVVIWEPEGPIPRIARAVRPLESPRLREAIVRLCEPSARFGRFEVWRRKPDAGPQALDRPDP